MNAALESPESREASSMGRPKKNLEEQTQIRITRRAYSAVRKAADIHDMTPPDYLSMIALRCAEADILEDAKRTLADAEARVRDSSRAEKTPKK